MTQLSSFALVLATLEVVVFVLQVDAVVVMHCSTFVAFGRFVALSGLLVFQRALCVPRVALSSSPLYCVGVGLSLGCWAFPLLSMCDSLVWVVFLHVVACRLLVLPLQIWIGSPHCTLQWRWCKSWYTCNCSSIEVNKQSCNLCMQDF